VKSSAIFVGILLFGPRMTAERAAAAIARGAALFFFGLLVVGLMYAVREYSDEVVDTAMLIWQREWKFFAVCGALITLALLIGSTSRR
jgi:hypothetical protein